MTTKRRAIRLPMVKPRKPVIHPKETELDADGLYEDERGILTATKIQLPQPYLSPTQIEMYLRCPMQYQFRYIQGKKDAPGLALVEGSSHHEALAVQNEERKRTGTNLKPVQMVEAFADALLSREDEIKDWEGESRDSLIHRGAGMVTSYLRSDFAIQLEPKRIEQEVTLPVGPVQVLGYLDVDGTLGPLGAVVADYKTVSKVKSQAELEASLQLTYYAMAERKLFKTKAKAGFVNLVKKKKPETVWQITTVSPGRIRWFRRIVLHVANSISRGDFPPTNPTNWCCSHRWCGYWSQCRGKYS